MSNDSWKIAVFVIAGLLLIAGSMVVVYTAQQERQTQGEMR